MDAMLQRRNLTVRLLALSTLLTFTSCGLFGGSAVGLSNVNELVSWIERVHVAAELAKERVQLAADSQKALLSGNHEGKALDAFVKFKDAIARSASQGGSLRQSVDNMKSAAARVFEAWETDLEKFKSEEMRTRSRSRLEGTRERYKAIVAAADPTVAAYDAVNGTFEDHALFLGNDFNANSVAEIADDVRALGEATTELQGHLNACLEAARIYLDAASPGMRDGPENTNSMR